MPTVWRIALTDPRARTPALLATLDAGEQARAARFHFARDAERWQAAHVALRDILGRRLGVSASAVAFALEANGKPRLAAAAAPAFNLSHSGDYALVAVADSGPLGVDLEALKPVPEFDDVAQAHFAADELAALRVVPETQRLDAFYRLWTRKEAYVKATGIGVGPALARFAMSLRPEAPQLLRDDDDARAPERWRVVDLALPSGYVGALVAPAQAGPTTVQDWIAPPAA